MNEKVTKFYEVVSADGKLQGELTEVTEGIDVENLGEAEARKAMADAVAAFAASHGLDLTALDLLVADEDAAEAKLSDAELESVGGGSCRCFVIGSVKGCSCAVLGGAKDGSSQVGGGQFTCLVAGL